MAAINIRNIIKAKTPTYFSSGIHEKKKLVAASSIKCVRQFGGPKTEKNMNQCKMKVNYTNII